jgi:MFS family permease
MLIAARSRVYYGWTLLVALGVITIVAYGTTQYLFGVLVVPVGRELHWSRAEFSLSYSIALVVSGLLGYPIGRWVDRKGARAVLACGSILAGLSLIGLSRVDRLWEWDLLWGGGLGIAGAMTLYPVTFTVVANWFHLRRGSAMALLTVLGGLASPIFIPLAGWLVPRVGWRDTLVIFGLMQLCITLPLAVLTVRRHPEDVGLFPDGAPSAKAAPTTPLSGTPLRHAMGRLPFWTITLTNCVAQLGSSVLFVHQVAYMIGRGQDSAVAAALAGMVGVVSLPGRYIFNVMSDRFHSQLLLGICQAVLAVGVVLLALARSTGWLIAYIAVYGAAFGAAGPLTASVRAEHFGRRAYGAISAVQGIPTLAGAALGPVAAGWIYDRSGSYQLAFAAVAALYVVSAGAMFVTPKPERTRQEMLVNGRQQPTRWQEGQ